MGCIITISSPASGWSCACFSFSIAIHYRNHAIYQQRKPQKQEMGGDTKPLKLSNKNNKRFTSRHRTCAHQLRRLIWSRDVDKGEKSHSGWFHFNPKGPGKRGKSNGFPMTISSDDTIQVQKVYFTLCWTQWRRLTTRCVISKIRVGHSFNESVHVWDSDIKVKRPLKYPHHRQVLVD